MKGPVHWRRSTREAVRARLASELHALAAEFGDSIALSWQDRSTPWNALIVGTGDRFVTRNAIRYWCEQGWVRRGEARRGGEFVLEVETIPAEAGQ